MPTALPEGKFRSEIATEGSIASTDLLCGLKDVGGGTFEDANFTSATVLASAAKKTGTPTAGRVASWDDASTIEDAGFAASDVALTNGAVQFDGNVTAGDGSSGGIYYADGAAGSLRGLFIESTGSVRWQIYADSAAETGSNAGSNFRIMARDDAGSLLSYPVVITRATGRVGINEASPSAQLDVEASTASTVALIANTASGATANVLELKNNGTSKLTVSAGGVIDFKGTMGNSSKDPATQAPADWVEIKIAGTTYYLPAYAA